MFRMCTYT